MGQNLLILLFHKEEETFSSKQMSSSIYHSPSGVRLLGGAEAFALDQELFNDYQYTLDQLMELAGQAVAHAVVDSYQQEPLSLEKERKVLIVCGPGNNGGDGLVAARHLVLAGWKPTIFYPKQPTKSLFAALVKQCQLSGVEFLTEMPASAETIEKEYALVLDAIFGFSFNADRPIRAPFDAVLAMLSATKVPIASVDVPSGWHVETGPIEAAGAVLQPHTLISLTAPKLCSQYFEGKHILGGRFTPPSLADKYDLRLPIYTGNATTASLSASK